MACMYSRTALEAGTFVLAYHVSPAREDVYQTRPGEHAQLAVAGWTSQWVYEAVGAQHARRLCDSARGGRSMPCLLPICSRVASLAALAALLNLAAIPLMGQLPAGESWQREPPPHAHPPRIRGQEKNSLWKTLRRRGRRSLRTFGAVPNCVARVNRAADSTRVNTRSRPLLSSLCDPGKRARMCGHANLRRRRLSGSVLLLRVAPCSGAS